MAGDLDAIADVSLDACAQMDDSRMAAYDAAARLVRCIAHSRLETVWNLRPAFAARQARSRPGKAKFTSAAYRCRPYAYSVTAAAFPAPPLRNGNAAAVTESEFDAEVP